MYADFLLDGFRARRTADAVVWRDRAFPYGFLAEGFVRWTARLEHEHVPHGAVVGLEADFSPNAVALLLALIERGCVVVPLTSSVETKKPEFRAIAEVEVTVVVGTVGQNEDDQANFSFTGKKATHELLQQLKREGHPGLILFSSGSTGKSKAAVHDFVPLLAKFKIPRHCLRTMSFLLFDHIGGVNTLFYTLANGGCLVTVQERSPRAVCEAIERHRVELLPTSPTFLNLLLVSEVYRRYDLSSLQLVTYGTEVMPESTLRRLHNVFPLVRLLQTYGLSEVGILRSKSKASDSLWVKVGGEGFQTRIVNGMLEIKAESAMLGYLNAPSPFTADGWFQTGDSVEVDGEWIRILGRASEIINVGGEKVYPAEVESVLQQLDGVEEVVVRGEPNPFTGQMVAATVTLTTGESLGEFRARMRRFFADRLARYKIPQKVVLAAGSIHGERFKKMRASVAS